MSWSIYEALRDEIVGGEIPAGSALRERALADRFGTSRTPIREALRRLEQDGWAERGPRGMRVRLVGPEELLEIYEVRIALEAAAGRAAAERRTEFDLLRLQRLHEAMVASDVGDTIRLAELNLRFHEYVWSASHNPSLDRMLRQLNARLRPYRGATLAHGGDQWRVVLADHDGILAAIRRGRSGEAATLAERHMAGVRNKRLQIYAERPDV